MRFDRLAMTMMAVATLAACGGDEEGPTDTGGHATVEAAAIYDATGTELESVALPAGSTTRLEVRFLDHDGAPIDLPAGHNGSLIFEPATLATAVDASDDSGFLFDVTTAASAGAGEVSVGYGHDGHIEETFGPFPIVVFIE